MRARACVRACVRVCMRVYDFIYGMVVVCPMSLHVHVPIACTQVATKALVRGARFRGPRSPRS